MHVNLLFCNFCHRYRCYRNVTGNGTENQCYRYHSNPVGHAYSIFVPSFLHYSHLDWRQRLEIFTSARVGIHAASAVPGPQFLGAGAVGSAQFWLGAGAGPEGAGPILL
jgi:hypothetical protein